jgi:hypothetical protein
MIAVAEGSGGVGEEDVLAWELCPGFGMASSLSDRVSERR